MKTLKALKITSIIQAIHCFLCLAIIGCIFLGVSLDLDILASIAFLLLYGTAELSMCIPPACFIVNLVHFLKDRKDPEQRKLIGKKWIWIFVWLIVGIACFAISVLPIRPRQPSAPIP